MTPEVSKEPIKVALIDLYNGEPNQGIRAITNIIQQFNHPGIQAPLKLNRYETRLDGSTPDLSYDMFLFSGGPGSPYDGKGEDWESAYFSLVDAIWSYNESQRSKATNSRKFALFICHSFQMMCRYFNFGDVVERQAESFGIFKTHQTEQGKDDILFSQLSDPFYAADFRKWQVIQPNTQALAEVGAEVIAIEKNRQNSAFERAMMGIRINPEMAGVQFHPEADPTGMLIHFNTPERKARIIDEYGKDQFDMIIRRLQIPEYLDHTYKTIIPNFLNHALDTLLGTG